MTARARTGPGRSDREGMTLIDLVRMFPNEAAARTWFEYWLDFESGRSFRTALLVSESVEAAANALYDSAYDRLGVPRFDAIIEGPGMHPSNTITRPAVYGGRQHTLEQKHGVLAPREDTT